MMQPVFNEWSLRKIEAKGFSLIGSLKKNRPMRAKVGESRDVTMPKQIARRNAMWRNVKALRVFA